MRSSNSMDNALLFTPTQWHFSQYSCHQNTAKSSPGSAGIRIIKPDFVVFSRQADTMSTFHGISVNLPMECDLLSLNN